MEASKRDTESVVIGLYRHDVAEEETLRHLLTWMRKRDAIAVPPVVSLTSQEDAQTRLALAEYSWEVEQRAADPKATGFLPPPKLPGTEKCHLDETAIDRVVASNGRFPERIRVLAPLMLVRPASRWPLTVTVGYGDELPDDYRVAGRRLVQVGLESWDADRVIAASVHGGEKLASRRARPGPSSPAEWARAFVDLYLVWAPLTYATIQCGRPLPTPSTFRATTDPRDFDRLYVRMNRHEALALAGEFDDCPDWQIVRPADGVYITRQPTPLSEYGRRFMEVLRAKLLSKLL